MEKINHRVKILADVLSDFPKCFTINPTENRTTENEFCVGFAFRKKTPEKIVEETLLIIIKAIRRFDGKVTITEKKEPDDDGVRWEIRGRGVSPDYVALEIMSVEGDALERQVDALVARRGW